MGAGPELPSGTVTFLFTDIEGSTRLLSALGQDRYGEVLAEHARLLGDAFAAYGGQVVDTQGDSFFVAFRRAREAVAAALEVQQALAAHDWPQEASVKVRIGLHTGEPVVGEERYVGLGVHRASRIGDAGHGGQILVSQTTRELLRDDPLPDVRFRDLGAKRLKGLDEPERIYQVTGPGLQADFKQLRTERKSRRVDRRLILVALVLVGGAVAAGVVLTRGSSTTAQASAGVAADSVGVFNASNGKLIAQAPVRSGPSALAVGEGTVWVANVNEDSVSRIDPATRASVQTIPVGNGPAGIAVGGGFVWVANSLDGTVSKIDPNESNGTVVDRIQVGSRPAGVAFGEGSVWVANSGDRTVTRIDAGSGQPQEPISVDAGADAIAIGDGGVWVASESAGSVARIDPRTRTVIQPIQVGGGPTAVAVGREAIWVTNSVDGTVSRIDPVTSRVRAVIGVGDGPRSVAVAPDGKTVWVSNELGGTLSQVDSSRNIVVKTIPTGYRPRGVAVSGDAVYVAVRGSSLIHRGGTLTVARLGKIPPVSAIDPASGYGAWDLLTVTNDGLVGYKRVAGGEGYRLVADLATALPDPSDGGRTYTFQLRRGIRYSTGVFVRPADFRHAIEHALMKSGGDLPGAYFAGIAGGERCVKRPKSCDLSKGIVADDASNTLTFRLTAPDADFLYKLALPTAFPVPAGTSLNARLPLPATGPYRIASYDVHRGVIRLVRNSPFRLWSAAAQPEGFPDEIVERFGYNGEDALAAVERGRADLTYGAGSVAAQISALRKRYLSQLHINPALATFYVWLNTRRPPFNDIRARRAFNYAVDRNRLIELAGGPSLAQVSCQVLPPNLDGYRRYCPYTLHPRPDGRYTGPDVAQARRLVEASGTRGQSVSVWVFDFPIARRDGNYLVSVLRSIGYRAQFKTCIPDKDCGSLADSRRKIQAAVSGWGADFPSADNFFSPLFTCRSFVPRSKANLNPAEFCNRTIDAEIARAHALQTSDPRTASQLWIRIDREITNRAPWVVMRTPVGTEFVSRRVGNYTFCYLAGGTCLDQLWVREQ